jgi:hypothetical protein
MTTDEKRAVAALFAFAAIVILVVVTGPGVASLLLEILSYMP